MMTEEQMCEYTRFPSNQAVKLEQKLLGALEDCFQASDDSTVVRHLRMAILHGRVAIKAHLENK